MKITNRYTFTGTIIFSAIVLVLCGFAFVQKNLILYHWKLRQLQQVHSFGDKLKYAEEIASLADADERIAVAALDTLKGNNLSQADKPFIIATFFVPQAESAKYLNDLLSYVSQDSCSNAELISHAALKSFEHGLSEYGWAFYDLAGGCSASCKDCLVAAFSILFDLPLSEIELGLQKVQVLDQESSSAKKLATVIYNKWVDLGRVSEK